MLVVEDEGILRVLVTCEDADDCPGGMIKVDCFIIYDVTIAQARNMKGLNQSRSAAVCGRSRSNMRKYTH